MAIIGYYFQEGNFALISGKAFQELKCKDEIDSILFIVIIEVNIVDVRLNHNQTSIFYPLSVDILQWRS